MQLNTQNPKKSKSDISLNEYTPTVMDQHKYDSIIQYMCFHSHQGNIRVAQKIPEDSFFVHILWERNNYLSI